MTTTTDFLSAIIADPDDDTVRLVMADWLEESGQADRGAFIRTQVELADDLRHHGHRYCTEGSCVHAPAERCTTAGLRRREHALFTWHNIERWFGHRPWLRTTVDPTEFARLSHDGIFAMMVRRGFVERVTLSCRDWLEHGPALVRQQPITAVNLPPLQPWSNSTAFSFDAPHGYEASAEWSTCSPYHIPPAIWDAMEADAVAFTPRRWKAFRTREGAVAGLSRAAISWAKSHPTPPAAD